MAGWIHQALPITEEQLSVFTGIRNLSALPPVLLSTTGLILYDVPAIPAVSHCIASDSSTFQGKQGPPPLKEKIAG